MLGVAGAGLTGYGAYRARRALRKIQNNRRLGRDWRGRRIEGGRDEDPRAGGRRTSRTTRVSSRGNVQQRLLDEPTEEGEPEEPAGSRETRGRELRQARNVARSRPNQSSIMDDEEGTEMEDRSRPRIQRPRARLRSGRPMEQTDTQEQIQGEDPEEEPDEFRQARPQEERTQPRARRSLRERFSRRAVRPRGAQMPEETELQDIKYTNIEEDPTLTEGGEEPEFGDEFEGGEGEGTEMRTIRQSRLPRPSARSFADESSRGRNLRTTNLDEPVEQPEEPMMTEQPMEAPEAPAETFEDSLRPVSLEDAPDNPAVQSQWQRSFRSKLQRLIRKPPAAEPEAAETELRTAQQAETSAQAEATESDTSLDEVDDAFQQSKASLAKQQQELRQTRTQLAEEPEEARPTDLPDDTFDEAQLDAQAEADVAGAEGEGLEDEGDMDANLDEEEEDPDTSA